VLSALSSQPWDFAQLHQQLDMSDRQLAATLTALYFASSITTEERYADERRLRLARLRSAAAETEFDAEGPLPAGCTGGLPTLPGLPRDVRYAAETVPMPLGRA
jgi:hypothetical protein